MTFRPHPLEWTAERVERYWDFLASNPSYDDYFSRRHASDLADRVIGLTHPRGLVVDVGCGRGDLVNALTRRGVTAIGIDSSAETIRSAAQAHPNLPSDTFRGGSVTSLPLPDDLADVVSLVEVVEHLPNAVLSAALDEARRVLGPRGRLFVTTPNREDLATQTIQCPECGAAFHTVQHVRSWSPDTLRSALAGAGFRSTNLREAWLIPEGPRLERLGRRVYRWMSRRRPHLLAIATR